MSAPALTERLRLTVLEASAEYGPHPVTIRRALEADELHGSQRCAGGKWSIRRECLDAWMDGVKCPHRKAGAA